MTLSYPLTLVEETEQGIVEGCTPSPWAPCSYPEHKTYRKEYTIKRTYSIPTHLLKKPCGCEETQVIPS